MNIPNDMHHEHSEIAIENGIMKVKKLDHDYLSIQN